MLSIEHQEGRGQFGTLQIRADLMILFSHGRGRRRVHMCPHFRSPHLHTFTYEHLHLLTTSSHLHILTSAHTLPPPPRSQHPRTLKMPPREKDRESGMATSSKNAEPKKGGVAGKFAVGDPKNDTVVDKLDKKDPNYDSEEEK